MGHSRAILPIYRVPSRPNCIAVGSEDFRADQADAVIARIREVADEIRAERDAGLIKAVSWSIHIHREETADDVARIVISNLRNAGYTITKDGASS